MALVIKSTNVGSDYIGTGTSVGFPGEYSNRSFMLSTKFRVTGTYLNGGSSSQSGDLLELFRTGSTNYSVATGFPAVSKDSSTIVYLQVAYPYTHSGSPDYRARNFRLKVVTSFIDNFPVLASYANTGVYLHTTTMYSNNFTLDPSETTHLMFRMCAPERNTTANGSSQSVSDTIAPGGPSSITTSTGWNTSSTGFDYTKAYINGVDVWSTLNWTILESSYNAQPADYMGRRTTGPWRYYSSNTNANYNKIADFNQGTGSYYTGFNYFQFSGYNSTSPTWNPSYLHLDETWIGDWDGYTGTNAPGIANFWSGGYVQPTADGTLANGLRARIYFSSIQGPDQVTNLGSLGSAADLITRVGTVGQTLEGLVSISSTAAVAVAAVLFVPGAATLSSTFITTATSNKIIGVIVGRYFSDDYVEPGYVTDDTFNASSTLAATGSLFKGLVETVSAAFGLNATANMLYGTDYGIELIVYSLVVTESEETLAGEVLNAGTFTVTADGYVYQGGVAVLSSEFTFALAPRTDHYGTADLAAAFSVAVTGNFLGTIIDMADQVSVYTWDDPPTWENMNNGVWSVNGLLDQTQFTLTILCGIVQAGEATATATATLTTTATFVTFATAVLESYFSVISGSRIVKDAEVVVMPVIATLTATGLRTQEIAAAMFGACELTTTASVQWSAAADLSVVATVATVGGVRWLTPQASVQSTATMVTVGGVRWLTPTAVLAAHAAIVARGSLSKIDPYRRYKVTAETRTIPVSADNRTIMVPENTRVFLIAVPPIVQPTIERQQV